MKRSPQVAVSLIDYSSFPNLPHSFERQRRPSLSFSRVHGDQAGAARSLFQKRIMVCDDESDVLRAYRIALASKYNVLTASSGEECLRKYEGELKAGSKVDVLLLDYKLGDMLGDEVACKIRDMDGTKIILISAYEIESNFLGDLKQRNCITAFVKKPITMSSLLSTIEKTLQSE